jgi:glycosyltransferase involved in cell wall biosynthesis
MKIALITGSYPDMLCGVGDYSARLAEALINSDKDLHIDLFVNTAGCTNIPKNPRITFNSVNRWGLVSLPHLIKSVRSSQPDIIHIQYPAKGYGFGLAPNFLPLFTRFSRQGLPCVVTLHEFSIAHSLRKMSSIFFITCADKVIVCDVREQRSLNGFLKKNTVLIPLGANIPVLSLPKPQYHAETSSELTLCYFGFLGKTKAVSLLLDVLATLRRENFPARLLLIGGINLEDQNYLKSLARINSMEDYVSFTGYCTEKEVSKYLAGSDIALLPYKDGISLRRATFITAMQHGLPIVTTIAGDYLPDGLINNENVIFVDINDTEGFISAARALALDASLRSELGTNAILWGNAFNWKNVAFNHLLLYKEILKRKADHEKR